MAIDKADQDTEHRRGSGPFAFFREVRAEGRKVTWATWKEVQVSAIMVLIMGVLAAIFFFLVDTVVGGIIRWILNIG